MAKPQFIEGAALKIILPLNDNFFTGNEDVNHYDDQNDNYISVSDVVNRQIDGGVNDGIRKE